jgi:preprotein translocase subunit SecA
MYRVQVAKPEPQRRPHFRNVVESGADGSTGGGQSGGGGATQTIAPHKPGLKVGRNDLCPCGSGKKYKKCCLPKDEMAQA